MSAPRPRHNGPVPDRARCAPAVSTAGFTLMEVLVVLILMSMLMGIGVGAFSKVGGGLELARSQVREALRTTRHHALRERAQAVVLLDPESNSVMGVGWKMVGCWHFEESEGGVSKGFPVDAAVDASQIAPGGVIGNCLDLRLESNPGITISAVSSLNTVTGVSLELFVRILGPGERYLLGKGEFYHLAISEDGQLYARLKVRTMTGSQQASIEDYEIFADDYVVPHDRWVKVAFHFNGYSCSLAAEGIVRGEEVFPKRKRLVTDQATPVTVGNLKDPFSGFVDEVRIGIAVAGEELTLPESVSLGNAVRRVYFDREGRLDRSHHTAPVEIVIDHESSRPSGLTVGLFGEIW